MRIIPDSITTRCDQDLDTVSDPGHPGASGHLRLMQQCHREELTMFYISFSR